jgi:hypothetical protein
MGTPIAVQTNQQLDPQLLLGHILFLSMDEVKIHKDDLGTLFKKHNVSSSFLPHEIKPHDAYRRASSKAQGPIEVDVNGQKYKARLLVREVKKDTKRVLRHLVRELIDEKNEETKYATVGKIIYDRGNEAMDISWDPGFLGEYDYKKVLEDTRDLYVEWTQYHTKDTVRNIFNKVVKSMHPISITSGGRAQFIPKMNQDLLYSLKGVVEELPGASLAEIIPMIDTVDQRNLITKNLEKEVLYDVDKLLEDFSVLLQSGQPLRSSTVKRYAQAVVELQSKTQEYESLLSNKMTVLSQQLMAALGKVQSAPTDETSSES